MRGGRRWRRFLTLSGAYAYFFRFLYKPSIVRSKIEPAIWNRGHLKGIRTILFRPASKPPQAAFEKRIGASSVLCVLVAFVHGFRAGGCFEVF